MLVESAVSSFHQISSSSVSFNTIFSKIDRGVIVALLVIGTWAISLGGLLSIDVSSLPIAVKMAAMVWQTFLYTGLFITAHDGMHGAIAPSHPKLNHGIGSFAVIAYALFSYKQMIRMHWMHHQHPASAQDPDFHDGKHQNFFAWYFRFMMHYWSWTRVLGLVLLYHFMHHVLHIAEINLVLFWMIPSIASSVQLFFFGTYLPHREPETGYQNESRAQSSNWSSFWSFMTCYHFGYHLEHHENPHLPWWKLPEIHQRRLLEMS
jgi:beta-carotene ketolase (CrtW type)